MKVKPYNLDWVVKKQPQNENPFFTHLVVVHLISSLKEYDVHKYAHINSISKINQYGSRIIKRTWFSIKVFEYLQR